MYEDYFCLCWMLEDGDDPDDCTCSYFHDGKCPCPYPLEQRPCDCGLDVKPCNK